MFVIKRDGTREEIKFDKVTDRVKKLCFGLNMNFVQPVKVAQKVNIGMVDNITTQELDHLASESASHFGTMHPDYNLLAGRIMVSNLQKTIKRTFSQSMNELYGYINPCNGKHAPKIHHDVWKIIMTNADRLDGAIVDERDFDYDIFGIEVLRASYLLKCDDNILETPQYMHLRVAIGIHKDDIDSAIEMYEKLSLRLYTHSTPTIFNSGTPRPQMASCFLLTLDDDSILGIFKTLGDCAMISKYAGGIGLSIHDMRGMNSYIEGTGGNSSGIVPFLKIYNDTARAVNQGGKRKGSFAIYLEPHHSDIFEFIELRRPGGVDEFRTRDLFIALWVSDLFMSRMANNEDWTLFDPNTATGLSDVYGDEFVALYEQYERDGLGSRTVKAQELWTAICLAQIETGTPYLVNKDQCNLKSNQKNLGTIRSSNLCVGPETMILTDKGYYPIQELVDKKVKVWNGEEWSPTTVRQTGVNQQLIKVNMSNGSTLECTPYHGFCVETGTRPNDKSRAVRVDAKDLKLGMKLIKHDLPTPIEDPTADDFPYAYTHGFFCSDGTYSNKTSTNPGQPRIALYAEKKELIQYLDIRTSTFKETAGGTVNVTLYDDIAPKFTVPINYSTSSKLEWFAGVCDGDGTVARNGTNESIQVGSIHREYLVNIMYMLQTIGIGSKVTKNKDSHQTLLPDGKGGKKLYECQPQYRLLLSSIDTQKLLDMGFSPKRLKIVQRIPQRCARQFTKIVDIVDEGRTDNTYCFTEPKRGMGMFGGILTFNCSEIIQYSSPTEISVCNLSQINLSKFVDMVQGTIDYDGLTDIARHAIRNLNLVIDGSFYPVPEAEFSNKKHRPLGLGVSGLHDVFFMLKLKNFDCPEARVINKRIFETIYRGAILESIELAKEHGPYDSFNGSPASKGILQFDMWNVESSELFWDDWSDIKEQIMLYGLRNSLLLALMPTASSATILGVTECFEIQTSNLYSRQVLSGEYTIINKYLVNELIDHGLWNEDMKMNILGNDGSVQHIDIIPTVIRERYKTVWEYKMRSVVDMSADRSPFIDQSQSLNIFMDNPSVPKLTSMHLHSWKMGLKTMMYYLRSRAGTEAVKFTVDKKLLKENKGNQDNEECISCSA